MAGWRGGYSPYRNHINWEYIPGKKNIVADVLSRINLEQQAFEGEKETIAKVYSILKSKSDLENIMKSILQHQIEDPRINNLRQRLIQQDERITSFYCLHENLLFVKTSNNQRSWKLVIPKAMEKELILDYHIRYGHMGALKVMKALEEHTNIKNINRRVRDYIWKCHICQLVKCNNDRKKGIMQPITTTSKLERVCLDICGPLPLSLIHI